MGRGFRASHAYLPALAFIAVASAGAFTNLDIWIARAWAFDAAAGRFIGAGPGEWWAKDLVHGTGGAAVRVLGVAAILFWVVSRKRASLIRWRRAAGYVVAAAAASAALVGLLKNISNVDCPRSLDLFGGNRPYVHLFADRPDDLPRARCFPGGHSSSGFALFALYFALRDRNRALALAGLALALSVGSLFAFGQQARGAHFLSHDAWSAAIAWFACLAVYARVYKGRLWDAATP